MSHRPRRLVYVHGVRAKPPPEVHRELVWRCLVEGVRRADPAVARQMAGAGDVLDLVSWSHLFYPAYRDPALDAGGLAALLANDAPARDAIQPVSGLAWRARYWANRAGDRLPWLIRLLASRNMRINLAETARYLEDDRGVASQIRALLASALQRAWRARASVLLMAHSLGSVIAWDTLRQLDRATGESSGPVDLFLTLGSPLGNRYIRRRIDSAGAAPYPRTIRRWANVVALGDQTALGRRLADEFRGMRERGLVDEITDTLDVVNPFCDDDGLNVHKCYGYFVNKATGAAVARWWRDGTPAR